MEQTGLTDLLSIIALLFYFFGYIPQRKTLSDTSLELFQNAKKYYLEKKLDKSIELLKELTKKNKRFLNGYFMLGKSYFFNDQVEMAKKTWEKILRINPNHINTLIWLGILYSNEGEEGKEEAIKLFNKVLELDSLNLLANYNLGKIYFNKKEYKKTIYYFNNALENELHLSDIHIDLAKIYKELELNDRAKNELYTAQKLTNSKIMNKEINDLLNSFNNDEINKSKLE